MKGKLAALILLLSIAGGTLFLAARSPAVDAVHPHRRDAIQAVYATGTVEAGTMFPIAPRVAGRLTDLYADEGQQVAAGQVLAQLEDSDVRENMEQLRARAAQAQKDYARKAALIKSRAIAPEILEQALAARDAAVAAAAQGEAQMGFMKLSAPADGRIIRRDGEIGELIPVNQPVFWMACCTPLRISAEVDEEDIGAIRPGQEAAIGADAFPGRVFKGRVTGITPKGDPVARSYRVRLSIEGETPLMIGMTAETNIVTGEAKDALLVPAGAVKDGTVLVVRNGRIAKQAVKTGIRTPKAVQIVSGIGPDDAIVSDPAAAPEAGDRVRPVARDWKDE